MEHHGVSRSPTGLHRTPWSFKEPHRTTWNTMEFQGASQDYMEHHGSVNGLFANLSLSSMEVGLLLRGGLKTCSIKVQCHGDYLDSHY